MKEIVELKKESKAKRFLKKAVEPAAEIMSQILYSVKKGLNEISVVMEILAPVIISASCKSIVEMLICSLVFVFIIGYIRALGRNLNGTLESGMPVPKKKFVSADKNGFVSFNDNIAQEAILYLYELQEYLEKKGKKISDL